MWQIVDKWFEILKKFLIYPEISVYHESHNVSIRNFLNEFDQGNKVVALFTYGVIYISCYNMPHM